MHVQNAGGSEQTLVFKLVALVNHKNITKYINILTKLLT